MFSDCRKYLPIGLFFLKINSQFKTTSKFKYPNELATVIDKTAMPGGFEERHFVKIKYVNNNEEEVIECTHEEHPVKLVM